MVAFRKLFPCLAVGAFLLGTITEAGDKRKPSKLNWPIIDKNGWLTGEIGPPDPNKSDDGSRIVCYGNNTKITVKDRTVTASIVGSDGIKRTTTDGPVIERRDRCFHIADTQLKATGESVMIDGYGKSHAMPQR